ncbi:MAG: hypothetical protein E7Z92_01860 [Cyanobacteria bacterium SIG31]|nr:hypothetical protein [Cyanobacteria bacterium SIG31]
MITIDIDGTITLYQGDGGELVISGLDENKAYTVYFAIQDEKRNILGEELQVSVSGSDTVTFILTPEYTDLLVVPQNKPYKIYYYGIKVCEVGTTNEDTLFIADSTYGDVNRIIVYPRKVKGGYSE